MIKVKLFKHKIPLAVSWSLTNKCNLKCKYCDSYKIKSKELTKKEIFHIADELAYMGTQRISLIGGEPLIREDIGDIIKYLKKYNFHLTLTSNGKLIKNKIEDIRKIDLIKLSLDGPKKVHDLLRGDGSYNDVMEAIKIIKNNNIKLMINTTLNSYNLGYVDYILKVAEKFDIPVKFQPINNLSYLSKKDILPLIPDKNEYLKTIKSIVYMKKKSKYITNSIKGLEYLAAWPNKKEIKCYAGKIICRISPNGNLYPCSFMENKTRRLNCIEIGFKKAFEQLPEISCRRCWCSSTLELNLLMSFNPESILNLKKWI